MKLRNFNALDACYEPISAEDHTIRPGTKLIALEDHPSGILEQGHIYIFERWTSHHNVVLADAPHTMAFYPWRFTKL